MHRRWRCAERQRAWRIHKPTARKPIQEFELEKWFYKEEHFRAKNDGFVFFVHTKFLLIDPLSDDPLVCSGSANFSPNSLLYNDENMLLIRGDTRVADIYFGEYMRLFAHHRFRESVKRHIQRFGSAAFNTWKPQNLFEDWQQWVPAHFKAGSEYDIKRRYFAELDANPEGLAELRKALGRGARATLLYAAHDEAHNNAVALAEYLRKHP